MKTKSTVRNRVSQSPLIRSSKAWLDIAGDLTGWAIAATALFWGDLCLSQGWAGLPYGAAFIGLGLCVCPAIKMHWSLRAGSFVVCVALLS